MGRWGMGGWGDGEMGRWGDLTRVGFLKRGEYVRLLRINFLKYVSKYTIFFVIILPISRFSRLPIPDSRLPIPDSRFPIPDSRLPVPCSLCYIDIASWLHFLIYSHYIHKMVI